MPPPPPPNHPQQNLRTTKALAQLEAKEAWYDWRAKLLIPQHDSFKETVSHFERDLRYVRNFATALASTIADVEGSRNTLAEAIAETREARAEAERVDRETLAEQRAVRETQPKLLRKLEEELAATQQALAVEGPKKERLLHEKADAIQAIQQSQVICKDLMIFDPEELGNLRHEYRLLLLTHLWSPLHMSATQGTSLVYDSALAVHVERLATGGFKTWASIAKLDQARTRYALEAGHSKRLIAFYGQDKVSGAWACESCPPPPTVTTLTDDMSQLAHSTTLTTNPLLLRRSTPCCGW
jgi:hypothetical protein